MIAALGLLLGIVAGILFAPDVPLSLQNYLPIAVVAAMDAVFGGLRAYLDGIFDDKVFVVSFVSNVVIAQSTVQAGLPAILGLVAGLVVGLGAGALNGALVTRLKLPPFIVTLGTLNIFLALTLLYSGGATVRGGEMPELLTWTGATFPVFGVNFTVGVVMMLLLYVAIAFILQKTAWGRHVYAVGDDRESARLAGIRVSRVELKAIDPPVSIQDSMEKQMRAERDRRAAILTAEGTKQSAILEAEGLRQAEILRAEGDAKAAVLRAQGEAEAIKTVFDSIHAGNPDDKLLAYQYLQMLPKISESESSKLWIIPSELTEALKGIGSAFTPRPGQPPTQPPGA